MTTAPLLPDIARAYLGRGWQPIPVPFRQKAATLTGWPELRLNEGTLAEHFNGAPSNVSVILGEPSGHLVDIDLDAPQAVELADQFLPVTTAVFGRASKPRSHRLYSCRIDAERFADVDKRDDTAMVVEIRSTGGQTVFWVHTPSGEPIEWAQDGEPARIDAGDLRRAVLHLACAAMLARHWAPDGSRHDCALAAAGFLSRAGIADELVVKIVMAAARAAGDAEWNDRKRAAFDTVVAVRSGEPATGGPHLAELLEGDGVKIVERMRRWLGAEDERVHFTDRCRQRAADFARDHGRDVRYCWALGTWFESTTGGAGA
jgi:hypothetical protein